MGRFYSYGSTNLLEGSVIHQNYNGQINRFAKRFFINGNPEAAYPCDAQTATNLGIGMKRFLGYYDSTDPYMNAPIDQFAPGGPTAVSNPAYWFNGGGNAPEAGYLFVNYVPDTSAPAAPGCNPGNFVPIEYSVTSGQRYSMWSAVDSAWQSVQQLGQIVDGNPAMAFNTSTAPCGSFGFFSVSSDALTDVTPNADAVTTASNVIKFNPSNYDVSNPFNFEAMPSVGGTAEDLKAKATELAQNIVNSFVRCFYFNLAAYGEPCPPTFISARQGFVADTEVVSNQSLLDAQKRAQDIANGRNICLPPDIVGGGAGCSQTEIKDVSATAGSLQDKIFAVNLTFPKKGCVFSPEMTATTSLFLQDIEFTEMTICSVTGASKTLQVMSLKDYTPSQQVQVALKNKDD
jgi:hypothetical protein